MSNYIKEHLQDAKNLLETFLAEDKNIELISQAVLLLSNSLKDGGKILTCGNGGMAIIIGTPRH